MEYILLILFFVFLLFYLLLRQSLKPVVRSTEEVSDLLESWINNNIDWVEWDFFESCTIKNPRLESIRQRCLEIDYVNSEYLDHSEKKMSVLNEKGLSLVNQMLEECRSMDEEN